MLLEKCIYQIKFIAFNIHGKGDYTVILFMNGY